VTNFAYRIATRTNALVEVCIKEGTELAAKSQDEIMKTVRQRIKMHQALKTLKKGDVLELSCLEGQGVIRVNRNRLEDIKKPLKRFYQWLGFNIRRLLNTLSVLKKFNINHLPNEEAVTLLKEELNKLPQQLENGHRPMVVQSTGSTIPENLRQHLWDQVLKADKIAVNRPGVIAAAQDVTGMKIYDYGNFTDREMALFVTKLVNDYIIQTGKEVGGKWIVSDNSARRGFQLTNQTIKHIIVGHGCGTPGQNWRFVGGEAVQDYINRTIPKGEMALTVVCEDGLPRSVALREGRLVESKGNN